MTNLGRPSRTALSVAMRRAAHRMRDDEPFVHDDPLAVRVLGARYEGELAERLLNEGHPFCIGLRAFLVGRSRFAEDQLARGVAAGVTQYCLLGAGLDTFGSRNPYAGVRVFEVDHPATQTWKRELLAESGVPVPAGVTYAPVDFERESLADGLAAVGFDRGAKTLFAWLGVTMYLTLPAFRTTVGFVAGCAPGSGVVFDYGLPREELNEEAQGVRDRIVAGVAQAGEPMRLFMSRAQVAEEMAGFGFVEDLSSGELQERYFSRRQDGLGLRGSAGRLVCGWV